MKIDIFSHPASVLGIFKRLKSVPRTEDLHPCLDYNNNTQLQNIFNIKRQYIKITRILQLDYLQLPLI